MIPELDRFYREHSGNYGFLVITRKGTELRVSEVFQDEGYDLPVLIDPDNSIWAGYGIDPPVSTTVFINPEGTIAAVKRGVMTASDMALLAHGVIAPPFPDVAPNHPYAAAIYDLMSRGVISGFPDGSFGPDAPVKRQQFAKMIVKSLGLPVSGNETAPFVDVPSGLDPTDPFYPDKYVAVCAAQGITVGKTPTTFAPYDNITRQQLSTMVARAANLSDPPAGYTPPFSSSQFYPIEHYQNARKAAWAGLLDGLDGVGPSYGFLSPATRGEVCVLLYNLLHR